MAQRNQFGYETTIFVLKPDEGLNCPLCLNILNNPQQCSNGHYFCDFCIQTELNRRKNCPICKVKLSKESLSKCLFIKNIIDGLDTICISCDDDIDKDQVNTECCSWTGPMHRRQKHYDDECEFVLTLCGLENKCTKMIPKCKLDEHRSELCAYRREKCPHCCRLMLESVMENHLSVCEYRRVTCPNDCDILVRLNQLQQHLDDDCPLQHITCPMAALNMCKDCPGTFERGFLGEHVANSNVKPDQICLLASEYSNGERENGQLRERLQQLISSNNNNHNQLSHRVTTPPQECGISDVAVCNAGRSEVNGRYKYLKTGKCNGGIYERRALFEDDDIKLERLTMYKVVLNLEKRMYRWFISSERRDLYWANGDQFGSTPPSKWYCMSDVAKPAPTVTICNDSSAESEIRGRNAADNPFSSAYSASSRHKLNASHITNTSSSSNRLQVTTIPPRLCHVINPINPIRHPYRVSPSSIVDDMDNYCLVDIDDEEDWGSGDYGGFEVEVARVREDVRASLNATRVFSASLLRGTGRV